MRWRNPIPKNVRDVLLALEDLPRSARRIGGPEALCHEFAKLVDQTLLKPEATPEDVRRVCDEGARWRFAAVVVNPCYVRLAAECLADTGVHVASVAGFPLGASRSDVKQREAERALEDGAAEVDLVAAIGALRAGDLERVEADIGGVAQACRKRGALLKVILECALLNDEEKRIGARIALRAGADFVKTSTGFLPKLRDGGATAGDVALLRKVVGQEAGVKAAGGIRTLADAVKMLAAGASRIGTSSGVTILEELSVLVGK